MRVNELALHEKFRFKGHHYTIMKAVPRHKDVWDCMDEEGRHVPFRGDVEVREDQKRITSGLIGRGAPTLPNDISTDYKGDNYYET